MQFYIYYSTIPYKSVFTLKVQTNIDGFKKNKHDYHYYLGEDLSNFRYPDDELLMKGKVFSRREFDIISLLEKGQSMWTDRWKVIPEPEYGEHAPKEYSQEIRKSKYDGIDLWAQRDWIALTWIQGSSSKF